jgi:hypothetical protein
MVEVKNYLSYDGLSLYDDLIKQYIATADEAILNQILGELDPSDVKTIAELNELIRTASGTAGTALQQITVGTDGQFVTTTVSAKGEGTTQSVAVSVKTAALSGTEDGLVTASDARTALSGKSDKGHGHEISDVEGLQDALDGKVDKVEGKGLSANDFTDALKTKLDGIAEGAQVNYISSVGDNLAVEDGKLTVTIPEATVTGVDGTTVNGMKLSLDGTNVKLVDDGLEATLKGKEITLDVAETATEGYLKTYVLKQGTTEIGTIDLPKELVVTGGEVIVASTEEGLTSGEKYLKLTIANQDKPVYIAVKDLVDVYTEGAGIEISDSNVVSVKLAATQGNVTLDTTNGLKASLEGWETVQSASHTHTNKTVLDGITAEKVAAWDLKQDAMVAISDDEIEALFAEETSL